MGKSNIRELQNRLTILLGHLLKWHFQVTRTPMNEESWRLTIEEQRDRLRNHLCDNPGLKNPEIIDTAYGRAWRDGRRLALRETQLDAEAFPTDNPYTVEQALDDSFWPTISDE